jgi:peptide/nickel transport system permease protein
MIGLGIMLAFVGIAFASPWLAPYPEDRYEVHVDQRLLPPCRQHLMGTDDLGRDILSRILLGTIISLRSVVMVLSITVSLGVFFGVIAGYFGGFVDEVIMRTTDIFLAFPKLILAMAIATILGPNLANAILAISLAWWPAYARLVRGQALSLREKDFVLAARSVGAGHGYLMFSHVVPNCLTPVIIQASLELGHVITTAAALGFLGVGAQPPTPEWGLMISLGRRYFLDKPWLAVFPGLAIVVTTLGTNLFGDGLRDVLDPRWRTEGE